MLGDDARNVRVATADKIARDILYEQGLVKELLSPFEQQKLLRQAIAETPLEGSHAQQAAQQQTLEHMGHEYLLQEITGVIIARQIPTLTAYQAASRSGRKLRLSISQRGLVWRTAGHFGRLFSPLRCCNHRRGTGPGPKSAPVAHSTLQSSQSALHHGRCQPVYLWQWLLVGRCA